MAQPLIVPTAPKLESQKDSEEVRKSLLDLASKINEAILGMGREITALSSGAGEALTADEKAALAGTDGIPSGANPYVTDSDPRLSGSSPYLPTSDQLAALAGSYGTPSAENKYVTMYDPLLVTTAGTLTIYTDNGDVQTTSASPIKAKSKVTQRYGSIRVAFGIRTNRDTTNLVYGRVYINGNPVGPIYSTTSKTIVFYEGDFTIKRGDDIQVYIWSSYQYTPCICSYMTFKIDNTAVV